MRIIDISVPISPDSHVYSGDPPVKIGSIASLEHGDSHNTSVLSLSSHTGTHVDAPHHFINGRMTVDQLPLDALVGKAFVAEMTTTSHITAADLEAASVPKDTRRLLLKSINSKMLWKQPRFQSDYIALTVDGAMWVLDHNVRLVGIDYLSIEAHKSPGHPVHMSLLDANVVILEGLNLNGVSPGTYMLYCLPLKVKGGDGAPARAILIEE